MVEVRCPDDLTGAIMGDIQMRRGLVEGMESEAHFTVVRAKVPHSEMHQFGSSLRSLTQGRAKFKMKFDHYAPVSMEVQKKLTENYKKETLEPVEA
jgi:elongation factor G